MSLPAIRTSPTRVALALACLLGTSVASAVDHGSAHLAPSTATRRTPPARVRAAFGTAMTRPRAWARRARGASLARELASVRARLVRALRARSVAGPGAAASGYDHTLRATEVTLGPEVAPYEVPDQLYLLPQNETAFKNFITAEIRVRELYRNGSWQNDPARYARAVDDLHYAAVDVFGTYDRVAGLASPAAALNALRERTRQLRAAQVE